MNPTDDEIIEMAREAVFELPLPVNLYGAMLLRFGRLVAARAAAEERPAIIKALPGGHYADPQQIADMIRDRGQEVVV